MITKNLLKLDLAKNNKKRYKTQKCEKQKRNAKNKTTMLARFVCALLIMR